MAAKKKKVDPIKQREKRARIAAIVGVVLFLGVAAFEVPSMLKVMNKKPPVSHRSTTTTSGATGSVVLPDVAAGQTTGAVAAGQLADTDVPPAPDGAQLVSFSVFETKNPFTPQVTTSGAGGAGSSSPTSADKPGADVPPTETSPTATTPTTTTPAGAPPPTAVPSSPAATTTTAAPVVQTVAISVNGVVSRVASQGTFPSGSPVFRLVSWKGDTAEIGIVGGSYATGDATLTLHVGRPVTLQNTNDEKVYKLELLSTP